MTKQEYFEFLNSARTVKHTEQELEDIWQRKMYMESRSIQTAIVIPDIQPYRSTETGEVIGSRSKHRDHLKRHNLVELGNDKPKIKQIPKIGNAKQDLVETCRRLKVKGF